MTTLAKIDNTAVLAEFTGGSTTDVAMMIGIGLVKDSDAVFFQYLGEEQPAQALSYPSGKPVTRMANVRLNGIEVVDGIGEFASTKLNLFLESSAGTIVMLTSGLQTIWSQCVVTSLMGMLKGGDLTCPFNLDTWKGNQGLRPCFAAIRVGDTKISDNELYGLLSEARADRDSKKVETLMRNAVQQLRAVFVTDEVAVTVAPVLTASEVETDLF